MTYTAAEFPGRDHPATIDFRKRYEARKEIRILVEQGQEAEAKLVSDVRTIAKHAKGRAFDTLERWLSCHSDRLLSSSEAADIAKIVTFDHAKWVELHRLERTQRETILLLTEDLNRKEADYWSKSPLGFASTLFASESDKLEISLLKGAADKARNELNVETERLSKLNEEIVAEAKKFIEAALANLAILERSATFGADIKSIRLEMEENVAAVWRNHLRQELDITLAIHTSVQALATPLPVKLGSIEVHDKELRETSESDVQTIKRLNIALAKNEGNELQTIGLIRRIREQVINANLNLISLVPNDLDPDPIKNFGFHGSIAGAVAGAQMGAMWGVHAGIATGGTAIAATIPAAIVGGVIGYFTGEKLGEKIPQV